MCKAVGNGSESGHKWWVVQSTRTGRYDRRHGTRWVERAELNECVKADDIAATATSTLRVELGAKPHCGTVAHKNTTCACKISFVDRLILASVTVLLHR